MTKSIVFTDTIQPISLQASGVNVPTNSQVVVTGWGAIEVMLKYFFYINNTIFYYLGRRTQCGYPS